MNIKKEIKLPKLHNYFEVKVKDSKTGEILQEARAENVVLDQVYHKIASESYRIYPLNYMKIGDGSGTPSKSDTDLFNYVTGRNLENIEDVVTDDLITRTGKIVLTESQNVGMTITEVGLASEGTYSNGEILFTHAMLEDSEGNPISIGPKTETQIIEIFATVYVERGIGMPPFPNGFSNAALNGQYMLEDVFIEPNHFEIAADGTYDQATKTLSPGPTRVGTAEGNGLHLNTLFPTVDILTIDIPYTTEKLSFPNHSIFPGFSFSERSIGIGDGENKFFNFDNGFFIDGTEVIKVDGVVKTAGVDYETHQGARQTLNFLDLPYPYNSKIEADIYRTDSAKENRVFIDTIDAKINIPYEEDSIYKLIDFGSIIEVPDIYMSVNGSSIAHIYYSEDDINWNGPIDITYSTSGLKYINELRDINARYLWIHTTNSKVLSGRLSFYGKPSIEFITPPGLVEGESVGIGDGSTVDFALDNTPITDSEIIYLDGVESTAFTIVDGTITFDTAPAVDAVITADYKYAVNVIASWDTEVPPKNENFFYDISYSISFDW